MKKLEETARAQCSLDLQRKGYFGPDLTALVDRFWPVQAAEIYQGQTLVGEWPFTAEEIAELTRQLQSLPDK